MLEGLTKVGDHHWECRGHLEGKRDPIKVRLKAKDYWEAEWGRSMINYFPKDFLDGKSLRDCYHHHPMKKDSFGFRVYKLKMKNGVLRRFKRMVSRSTVKTYEVDVKLSKNPIRWIEGVFSLPGQRY